MFHTTVLTNFLFYSVSTPLISRGWKWIAAAGGATLWAELDVVILLAGHADLGNEVSVKIFRLTSFPCNGLVTIIGHFSASSIPKAVQSSQKGSAQRQITGEQCESASESRMNGKTCEGGRLPKTGEWVELLIHVVGRYWSAGGMECAGSYRCYWTKFRKAIPLSEPLPFGSCLQQPRARSSGAILLSVRFSQSADEGHSDASLALRGRSSCSTLHFPF